MTEKIKKPADRIKITVNETDGSLFMSYGLLSQLAALVGNQEELLDSGFSHENRDTMLRLVLVKRKADGFYEAPEDVDLESMDIDTAETILAWITGHLTAFFLRRLTSAQSGLEVFKTLMETMSETPSEPSQDSSPN